MIAAGAGPYFSFPPGFFLLRTINFLLVATALAIAAPAAALSPCSDAGNGWCLARRIHGDIPNGELGFRFGEPLDMDGDAVADIAAGARWKLKDKVYQNGIATLWSGATGAKLRDWDGEFESGMFGHWVLPVPDLDGDKLADVVVSAPSSNVDGVLHGTVTALSPKTGAILWRRIAQRSETLGWDLALAGDQNGDGTVDIFAGSPCSSGGRVYLLSGKDGSVLRQYEPPAPRKTFGWYVARTDDFDSDGHPDLGVVAFLGEKPNDFLGAAFLFSAKTGALLRRWDSPDLRTSFPEVIASTGDLDGDGRGEIAVSSAWTGDSERKTHAGEIVIFSGVTGKELRRWGGKQPGEHFGRMLVSAGDIDGDGSDDIAIGAPWYKVGDADKTGRVEIRSGKTGEVLAEWIGDGAESWFGWHIRRAPDPEGKGRPALLIGSLRQPVGGQAGTGVIDLYVLRR